MSESCESKCHFSSLLISDLILLCSFILSHPLYFSYFIFFAPYLLKLISFLSPLFITTFLLSLAFLTGFVHDSFSTELAQTRVARLLAGYNSVVEKFRFEKYHQNEEFQSLDDLGIYEVLFGSSVEESESPEEKSDEDPSDQEDLMSTGNFGDSAVYKKVEINSNPGNKLQNPCPEMEENRMENFLKILDEFERMASNADEKKKLELPRGAKADKVVEKQKVGKLFRNGSEATACNKINDATNIGGKEHSTSMVKAQSQRITSSVDHGDDEEGEEERKLITLKAESSRAFMEVNTYGSMRKEKEWKRTLACKLFEERHNVDGGEGMDSLWEAYEMGSNKLTKQKYEEKTKTKKNKNKKKSDLGLHEKYRGDNEEEEDIEGHLCCLQALKLSTGKMNLGVGMPNLVKISKAIKGIGWLHNVSKHSKKVHNNNGDRY